MNQLKTIPIHIISGFLGAGKTTLINEMLRVKPDEHILLLENELGEAGIDGQLIENKADKIYQINSGCICCQTSNELMDALHDILARSAAPDRLIIECTGIALPENIVAMFYSDPYLQNHYHIHNLVTVVDAAQLEDQVQLYPEPAHQIAFADIVVVNKIDLIRKDYLKDLENIINTIQPDAEIIAADWINMPIENIFKPAKALFPSMSSTVKSNENPEASKAPLAHLKYKSYTFHFDQPFDILALRHLLSVWLLIQKMRFIRIKGIISIPDEDHKVIIQSAGIQMNFKTITPPLADPADHSTIVIIGLELDKAVIEKQLKQCLFAGVTPIQVS